MGLAKKLSASGIAYNGACDFYGWEVGTDGVNDITDLTIYDGTTNAGKEIVATSDYEADYKGLNGQMGPPCGVDCPNGIYVEFTCAGAAEVVVYFVAK